MSRRIKSVIITAEGRDKGKTFVIHEMDADHAEKWAWRALEAIGEKFRIPSGILNAGWAGVAAMGLQAIMGAPFRLTGPLLDEMFDSCLSVVPDVKKPDLYRGADIPGKLKSSGPLVEGDIEEVSTRLFLRSEIFELHSGFSFAAELSRIWDEGTAAVRALSENTPTTSTAPQT